MIFVIRDNSWVHVDAERLAMELLAEALEKIEWQEKNKLCSRRWMLMNEVWRWLVDSRSI